MPSAIQHRHKAELNGQFESLIVANYLDDYYEWALTVSFYELLHQIDIYLDYYGDRKKKHPRTHDQREEFLKSTGIPNDILEDYILASRLSQEARYEFNAISKDNYIEYKKLIYLNIMNWLRGKLHGRVSSIRGIKKKRKS